MKTALSLVLFLVIGLIGSRGLVARVRAKLPVTILFLTGIEFFFLGILLGPRVLDLITAEVLDELRPVVYLALGWAGLLFGIQLSWQHIRRLSRGIFELLFLDGVSTATVFFVVFALLFERLFPLAGLGDVVFGAVVMAATGAISSPTIVTVLFHRLPSRGRFTSMVRIATSLSAVLPLLAFGLVFTIMNPGVLPVWGITSGFSWWLFANAFAVVMGLVFVLLTRQKATRDERLLIILGTVMLVGGLCYFLRLSALYTAMIMGIVVGNLSSRRVQIFEQLMGMERMIYVALLVFLGAMVSFGASHLILLLGCYVGLRLLLKALVSSWAIGVSFPAFSAKGPHTGLALSAQGGMALAVALDFAHGNSGILVETVLAVVAFGVMTNEVLGVYLTRRAFVAVGDAKTRKEPEREGGSHAG